MAIIFKHTTDVSKKYTIYVKNRDIEIRAGDITEENIPRNGSNYLFDCIDLTLVQFNTIELKIGSSYIP